MGTDGAALASQALSRPVLFLNDADAAGLAEMRWGAGRGCKGTVIMLTTPGHTPGHHSLLVKLPQMGNVIITGDAAHFRENYDSDGVPSFNYDRSQTIASLERLKKIAANLNATVIIQHDLRDVEKLPVFPASAK